MKGRPLDPRLDYFRNIGVTTLHKTAVSLLSFLVPLCRLLCVMKKLFTTLTFSTHAESVTIRHRRDKSSVLTSFETDIQKIASRYKNEIHTRYNRACGKVVVYLLRGSGAPRTYMWPICTYAQPIMEHSPLRMIFFFCLVSRGWPEQRSAL